MGIQLRHFVDEIELTATSWFEKPFVNDWRIDPARPTLRGETGPRWAVNTRSGAVGVAKPIKKTLSNPNAAHEKIASDLAYLLDLPVPPVALWDRGPHQLENRYVCVSLAVFEHALEDRSAIEAARASAQLITPAIGGMYAFYDWATAADRHDRHVLYGAFGGKEGLAFIDFGRSFDPMFERDMDNYEHRAKYLDDTSLRARDEVRTRIDELDDGTIRQVVYRIPEVFLPRARKTTIINRLLARREGR